MSTRIAISLAFVAALAQSAGAQIVAEPGWPITTTYSVSPSATIAQLDLDAPWEVVIASQAQRVYCYNHNGTLLPGWPQFIGNTLSPDQYAIINASPAVADLDNDGVPEIIVGSNDGRLYVFEPNGALRTGFPFTAGWMIFSTTAIGDVDGDGLPDICFGDNT